ncbi:MAG: hypothetical protein KZQ58_01120 [gamma proteobacterium symbiont of Bathyaustriella thionipta]|nr:hypothetical protein [gamma proteobacterium symbiont of Bathyaustriella thionipta]
MDNLPLARPINAYTRSFVEDTAAILIKTYQLHSDYDWLIPLFADSDESLADIIQNWIYRYIREVSPAMAESQFQLLLLEFESLYFNRVNSSCRI